MVKKILSAALVLSMILSLVGANTASALTAADIAMLQAAGIISASQAASLQASVTSSSQTTTTTSGYAFTRSLTIGSRGADVSALQQILVNGGFLVMPAGVAYGYFGALTRSAVVRYQLSKGITPAAGYFGPITRASIGSSSVTNTTTTTTTSTSGTDLAVTLSATSPMPGSIVSGQAAANLAEYTFTNRTGTTAIVTNVTLQRGGVSSDLSLSNVYLFKGAFRLTDSATVSSGKITFNAGAGLFTVAPGESVKITVAADILTGLTGGTINVSLTGVTANVPVAGSYPISGSTQTIIATPTDLATVTLASTSVATAVDAGTVNQTIWGSTFTLAGRAVWLNRLAVKVIGSIPSDSLQNLKLYVSGIQVAAASGMDSNGMVTFDLSSNPYKIDSSRNLEIRADIVNGSTRTFSVSLQNKADILVIDSNYNVALSVLGTLPTTNTITINGGSLTASLDTTLSSSDIVLGSTGVSLARYTLRGYGENVKVSYLNISANQDLTNVTLYANGASISSSANVSSTTPTLFSLGSSLIVNAGQIVTLEVRGDLKNSAGTNTATSSTVIITLSSYPNNAQGAYSSTLTTFPSSSIVGPTMTVVGGSLSVAKNASYNNQTLTANTANFKIGSFVLSSNSSEPVRVTGLTVALGGTLGLTSLSNLYTSENVNNRLNPQASNNFGADFTIAANSSKTVDVYADVGSLASSTTLVSGTGSVAFTGTWDNTQSATVTEGGRAFVVTSTLASTSAASIASSVATAINASTTASVTASVSSAGATSTLTLTAKVGGTAGNVSLSTSDTAGNGATIASGAALTGGATNVTQGSTVISTLTVTANGVNSNVNASSAAIPGQTMTVGTGGLSTPTLTSTSNISQFVIGGTGSTVGSFNFKATVGQATINEIGFIISPATSSAITSITVGGVTKAVAVGATTTVQNLAIVIPVSNAGVDVPVTVTYNTVGTTTGGVASNATSTLTLASVKFTSGNTTATNFPTVSANPMVAVAGYPRITIVTGSHVGLTSGSTVNLADVTITAVGNSVNLRTLPIVVTAGAGAQVNTQPITLQLGNTTYASTTPGALGANSLIFTGTGFVLGAGNSITFNIKGTATSVTAGVGTDSLTTRLGAASLVVWDDIEGAATGLSATLIPSYSTSDSNVITN